MPTYARYQRARSASAEIDSEPVISRMASVNMGRAIWKAIDGGLRRR